MLEFFSAFSWTEFFEAFMVLFAVIDIVGSIPIIIKVKASTGDIHPWWISIVSLGLMIAFLVLGKSILGLFHVEVEEFAVAGALILFAMALEMVMGIELFKDDGGGKTASIVPLAFPIIAGAGSMTTIISLRAEYEMINIMLAILVNIVVVFFVLKLTKRIERFLGPGGIAILKKVFGIILLAIAIKLFASNVPALFDGVKSDKKVEQTH
ncbi:MAG: MarC family protein [Lishizhenia sp.]